MKRVVLLFCFFIGFSLFGAVAAEVTKGTEIQAPGVAAMEKTPEETVTGSGSLAVLNKYIFRGYELSKNSVVLQPALTASLKGFAVSLWGNIDMDGHDTQSYFPGAHGKEGDTWFNETDLTLSYTCVLKRLSFTGGYIYYNTRYAEETEELFIGLSLDILSKPTLTVYRDITSYPGTYVNLSIVHSFDVWKEKGITFDLGASAAYFVGRGKYWRTWEPAAEAYTGEKYRAFHDGMVKAGFTVPVTKAFSVQPTGQYWFPLSDKSRKRYGTASLNPNGYLDNNVVYGMTFSYSF